MAATEPGVAEERADRQPWRELAERYQSHNRRLIEELRRGWADLHSGLREQIAAWEKLTADQDPPGSGRLESYLSRRAAWHERILAESRRKWERDQGHSRSLRALEQHENLLVDLLRQTPQECDVRSADVLPSSGMYRLLGRLWAFGGKPSRCLDLSGIFSDEISRARKKRISLQERYLVLMAGAGRDLLNFWTLAITALDRTQSSQKSSPDYSNLIQIAAARLERREQSFEQLFAEWQKWEDESNLRLTKRVLLRKVTRSRPVQASWEQGRLAHWVQHFRSLDSDLSLSTALWEMEQRVSQLFLMTLQTIAADQAALYLKLDEAIAALNSRLKGGAGEIATERPSVLPSHRFSKTRAALLKEMGRLPEHWETPVRPVRYGRKQPGRVINVRQAVAGTIARLAEPELKRIGQELDSKEDRLIQEIERAADVVAFGAELEGGPEADSELSREAVANALSLLQAFREGVDTDSARHVEDRITRVLAAVYCENRLILGRHQLGVFTHVFQQQLRQGAGEVIRDFTPVAESGWQRIGDGLNHAGERLFVAIGWREESTAGKFEIVTRPFLPQEFIFDPSAGKLPKLYRHLFRLEPLADSRFLIGRDREMEAIAEAKNLWLSGRPVGIIIVGERGSGKTSLINCALKDVLAGMELVRGEFNHRVNTEEELYTHLASFFPETGPADLEAVTRSGRRVVILEELERTYLRTVGGYKPIKALERIIASSTTSTLWIVSINSIAYRFINAVTGLGQVFSHRINAGTASRADLREAILLRHRLSGLRLGFLPPLQRSKGSFKRRPVSDREAEELFFNELFAQSSGVFRTAFDIWLGQIESIEAGLLSVSPLTAPDLTGLVEGLELQDLFALMAILQHGGLTTEEHARVFQTSSSVSAEQLSELRAREIIEPEPERPGFRVRPEATRLVKEALHRRNLSG
jgi:hypothetical protein